MDFVTNSSSTAFCIIGVRMDLDLFNELEIDDTELDYETDYNYELAYFGVNVSYINMNSNKSFKEIYDDTLSEIKIILNDRIKNGYNIDSNKIDYILKSFDTHVECVYG